MKMQRGAQIPDLVDICMDLLWTRIMAALMTLAKNPKKTYGGETTKGVRQVKELISSCSYYER